MNQNNDSLPIVLYDDILNDTESEWDSYFSLAIIAVSVGKIFFTFRDAKRILCQGTIWYILFFRIIKRAGQRPVEEWWLPDYRKRVADQKELEKLTE